MAVERGRLNYTVPVALIWPEFAAKGKETINLDLIMSHRAGLNGLDVPMDLQGVYDWFPYVDALAGMAPLWKPGSRCVYHAMTYGHLAGEALRRADGRMPGRFIAEEIAGPLELDLFVGLPAEEEHRVAEITASEDASDWLAEVERSGYRNAMHGPRVTALTPNDRAWQAAEIPAGNGQANALSLARLYGLLACGGGDLISSRGIAAATSERFNGMDVSMNLPTRFGAGFRLGRPESQLGPNPASFGHTLGLGRGLCLRRSRQRARRGLRHEPHARQRRRCDDAAPTHDRRDLRRRLRPGRTYLEAAAVAVRIKRGSPSTKPSPRSRNGPVPGWLSRMQT